jgi:hypothetical protein
MWLTRFEGDAVAGAVRRVEDVGLKSLPAFHEARTLGAKGCGDLVGAPPTTAPAPEPVREPAPVQTPPARPPPTGSSYHQHGGCDGFAGCSRQEPSPSSSSTSGCGGDSKQSSNDGCGKSSKSSDDGCGKSSKSSDDGCGKSSKSSDDGCGKSSSGAGDGCGKASKGADNGCAYGHSLHVRPSAAGFLAIAFATAVRRLARRRRAG